MTEICHLQDMLRNCLERQVSTGDDLSRRPILNFILHPTPPMLPPPQLRIVTSRVLCGPCSMARLRFRILSLAIANRFAASTRSRIA